MTDRIFGFWTGDNPMNENRQRGWASFPSTGLAPVLVTPANLDEWISPGHGKKKNTLTHYISFSKSLDQGW